MIQIMQEVEVYEIDDVDVLNKTISMGVNSHWNQDILVVISFEGKEMAVNGVELKRAIDNAMKSRKG